MKNKIIIALVAVVAWLGQSCETDPAFDFKDEKQICWWIVLFILYMGKTFRMGKILCGFNYRLWEPVKISTEIIKWSLLPIAVPVRKVWISIS